MAYPGYPPQNPYYPAANPTSMPPYPTQGGGFPGGPPPAGFGFNPQMQYPPQAVGPYPASYNPNAAPGYPPTAGPGYPPASGPGYPPASGPGYPPASGPGYPPAGLGYGLPPQAQQQYPGSFPQPGAAPGYNNPSGPGQQYPGSYPPPDQGYIPPPVSAPNYSSSPAHGGPQQGHAQESSPPPATATFQTRKFVPTVRPKVPYGPAEEEADAAALRKAMKGFGTDEKAIIAILANRSNGQRQLIAKRFMALYGKDLIKDLKSELGGKFEDVVVACMTPLDQYFARELHHAMAGIGTNEDTLIEILCSLNNAWLHAIKNTYQQQYGKSLESDIKGDTSGCFERLLLSLCQAMRDENPNPNPAQVQADVQALYQAGAQKIGTDESTFNAILANRSLTHLRAVFQQYHTTHGTSFEKVIKDEFSGSAETGLLAIVKCMTDCSNFFAERLYDSMAGAGTKDRALIRIVVSRSECDLGDIKVAFQKKYGKSLESFIEGDCSGDYKKMLIAMVTAN